VSEYDATSGELIHADFFPAVNPTALAVKGNALFVADRGMGEPVGVWKLR
jgi:hypothetical protein